TVRVCQSGAGKSTLARMLHRLIPATSGQIRLEGRDVPTKAGSDHRRYVGDVQLTLQDPFASLNPLRKISYTLGRAVRIHQDARGQQAVHQRNLELLERVGLIPAES